MDRLRAAQAIDDFLRAIGRDPKIEPELRGTGERVAAAFIEDLCDGYLVDIGKLIAENVVATTRRGELVVVRELGVSTVCPHHLMPATGVATVAYVTGSRILGIGTVGKVVDAFAHRLALQEQIGRAVVEALLQGIEAEWVGCRLSMTHSCLVARGDRKHGARVDTVSLAGEVNAHDAYRVLGASA